MAEFSGSQNFVFSSQLSISSLSYSYPGSTQPVLKDLSFTITPGKILLVRGENGSGKTTLLHIMNRLLFTYNGEVTIDEIAIDNFDYQSFRKSVGYLPQCSTVFNDTIKNNLTLGYAVENTQIDKCLEAFGMKTLIESLPQGIDTVIGENGFQLSGGNLQKLALIRLLLREYKLLLLDEPTASLDEDSKKEFRNIISRYAKEKQVAIVMVTHNSDDIQIADYQISLPS